ncbi:crossover junction endodeoxyribonuclease RuvC [Psychrobacillus sp. FSL K6-1464]|uniref:crossover junction endodeoxyribonuclease RuvC n=1 Tax=Psychrobacillus sp. FSL K6-1464 TaxID=2921545 RepID=UPI0030F5F564
MQVNQVFLGVDQGIANCGYAFIQATKNGLHLLSSGTIKTPAKTPSHTRVYTIFCLLEEYCSIYKPIIMGGELLMFSPPRKSGGNESASMMTVNLVSGALCVLAAKQGIDYKEYIPGSIRKTVTGKGKATQQELKEVLSSLINKKRFSKHELDAVAIAVHLEKKYREEREEKND